MFNFIKNKIYIFNERSVQHQQLYVNAENEYQAMSCGLFNRRLLAMIKRSEYENNRKK